MTQLTITYTESNNELYHRYQGQTQRQPVRLCLNLETGELGAYVWGNIGGGQTCRAFNRVDIEWTIPPLRVDAFREIVAEFKDNFQAILDDSDVVWDGHNHVGQLGNDAQQAYEEISFELEGRDFDDADIYEVWDASDYYGGVTHFEVIELCGLRADMTDEEIDAIAVCEVGSSDVELDVDDVASYLRDVRDEIGEDE